MTLGLSTVKYSIDKIFCFDMIIVKKTCKFNRALFSIQNNYFFFFKLSLFHRIFCYAVGEAKKLNLLIEGLIGYHVDRSRDHCCCLIKLSAN